MKTLGLLLLIATANADQPGPCARTLGSVAIARLAEVRQLPEWQTSFARFAKDNRYYEIVEETINPEFDYRYFIVRDAAQNVVGVQPFLLLDQDMLEAAPARVKRVAGVARRLWPSFLKLRVLMVGSAAGPGQLAPAGARDRDLVARTLATQLPDLAREQGARLAILKEFPREERDTLRAFTDAGFAAMPGMPHTRHDLSTFKTFADYRASLSRNGRRSLDRHAAASADQGITLEVRREIPEDSLDETFALYQQTLDRAPMRFEVLTPAYLRELGRRMPDRARFFFWRREGKMIAMALCLAEGETLLTEYLGLDYDVARDLGLYFRVQYDVIDWAIQNDFRSIVSTPLVYEPKLYLGHALFPVDLYVGQTVSPRLNGVFKRVASRLNPTLGEPLLKRFKNHDEIHVPR